METEEKTLAGKFRTMSRTVGRYYRIQTRKAYLESCARLAPFDCLNEEEQKTLGSYLDRVTESVTSQLKNEDDDCDNWDFFGDRRDTFFGEHSHGDRNNGRHEHREHCEHHDSHAHRGRHER